MCEEIASNRVGQTIKRGDFNFPIRLANNAAPELNEEGGAKSKAWLEEQIMGEEIMVLIDNSHFHVK